MRETIHTIYRQVRSLKNMRWMFLILLLPLFGMAREMYQPDLSEFSRETLTLAKANSEVSFMTKEEQDVVFYMNLVRLEPQIFMEAILKPYVAHYELNKNHYVKSLYSDLKKANSVKPLVMKQDLYEVSKSHLDDIGEKGIEGHTGSNGKTFKKRVDHLFKTYISVSENVGLGFETPLDNVIGLLIDDGVKDVGHRKAILSPNYNCVGVSLGNHKNYIKGCVMDFGQLEAN